MEVVPHYATVRTLQEELYIYNTALWFQLPIPLTSSLFYKHPSILAHRRECAHGLQCPHALGCNPFYFPNKSFLVTKHPVNIIFKLTSGNKKKTWPNDK